MEDPVSIGPWRILGRLGAGGMGVVFRARQTGGTTVRAGGLEVTNRSVAVKSKVHSGGVRTANRSIATR